MRQSISWSHLSWELVHRVTQIFLSSAHVHRGPPKLHRYCLWGYKYVFSEQANSQIQSPWIMSDCNRRHGSETAFSSALLPHLCTQPWPSRTPRPLPWAPGLWGWPVALVLCPGSVLFPRANKISSVGTWYFFGCMTAPPCLGHLPAKCWSSEDLGLVLASLPQGLEWWPGARTSTWAQAAHCRLHWPVEPFWYPVVMECVHRSAGHHGGRTRPRPQGVHSPKLRRMDG